RRALSNAGSPFPTRAPSFGDSELVGAFRRERGLASACGFVFDTTLWTPGVPRPGATIGDRGQAAASRLAPRVLRRRRACSRDGRAGTRAARAAGVRPAADRAQPPRR